MSLLNICFRDQHKKNYSFLFRVFGRKKNAPLKRNTGFTLLEILIAISILGIVMGTIFGIFTGIISGSRNAAKKAELYQTGRVLMDLITADIRGIFGMTEKGVGQFFIGTTETVGGKPMSRMDFITTNSLQIGRIKNPFLSEVGYMTKISPQSKLYSLWRRAQSPPESPYEKGGRAVPVCRILEDFRLEFLYNNDRRENLSNSIPAAVVINFSLNQDGERGDFMTMVRPMITTGAAS